MVHCRKLIEYGDVPFEFYSLVYSNIFENVYMFTNMQRMCELKYSYICSQFLCYLSTKHIVIPKRVIL